MDVNEQQLRAHYSSLNSEELISLYRDGVLTDLARSVLIDILGTRGVDEEALGVRFDSNRNIHFRCPKCSARYVAKIEQLGKRGNCKKCGAKIVVQEQGESRLNRSPSSHLAKSFKKFCPKCAHFQQETGVCTKFYFNVRDYQSKFLKKCNGGYFKQDTTKAVLDIDELEATTELENAQKFEVSLPSGEIKKYSFSSIKQDILAGNLKKDYKARLISDSQSSQENESKEPTWSTLEEISNTSFQLRTLYRPIWAYTMKWLWYGILGGMILNGLAATIRFFTIEPLLGIVWLAVIASGFFRKWWAPAVVILVASRLEIRTNLFITVILVGIVGALFGGPLGMIIGTLIGHFKATRIQKAPDAISEGSKPYYIGLVAPAGFFCIILSLYLFWILPLISEAM